LHSIFTISEFYISFMTFPSPASMGLLQAGSLFALLTFASATPIVQQTSRSGFIDLPKSYAALGDSFAAGLGSGFFLNHSADASDSMLITPSTCFNPKC
jgi:hypothetical protein